jgi:tRNA(fMet)-specific endonuclease VapC
VYLLDTDHIGILQWRSGPEFSNLTNRLLNVPPQLVFKSVISFQEQVAGWQKYLNKARAPEAVVRAYAMFEQILTDFNRPEVVSFDHAAALKFQELRSARIRIGTLDLRIAAIALTRDYTVLTRNLVDFGKVPGLSVEDWTLRVA